MKAAVVAMAAVLAGCAGMDPLPRPAEGYPAIRFLQPVRVPAPLGGVYVLNTGTTLVADQAKAGRPYYCGLIFYRDVVNHPVEACATYADGMLTVGADRPVHRPPYRLPPGVVEEIRLR